jgi:large repetitive protein
VFTRNWRKLFAVAVAGFVVGAYGPGAGMAMAGETLDCSEGVPGLEVGETTFSEADADTGIRTATFTIANRGDRVLSGITVEQDLSDVLDDTAWEGVKGPGGGRVHLDGETFTWSGELSAGDEAKVTYRLGDLDADTPDDTGSDLVSSEALHVATTATSIDCGAAADDTGSTETPEPDASEPDTDEDEPRGDDSAATHGSVAESAVGTLTNVQIRPIAAPGMCWETASNGIGAKLTLQTCSATKAMQRWDVTTDDRILLNSNNARCIENLGNSTALSQQLQLGSSCASGATNATWPYQTATGTYRAGAFVNSFVNLCADVRNGVYTAGAVLQTFTCNAGDSQTFSVGTVDFAASTQTNVTGKPGASVTPQIKIQNLGPQPSIGQSLSITGPSGFTMTSAARTNATSVGYNACVINSATVATCPTSGNVWFTDTGTSAHNGDGSGLVSVTGTIPSSATPGTVYNVCGTSVAAVTVDTASANNSACATVTVIPAAPDLRMTAGSASVTGDAGSNVDTTFTLDNLASNALDYAQNPLVSFTEPSGYTITGMSGPAGWACNTAALLCTYSGNFAAGASADFTVSGTIAVGSDAGSTLGDVTASASTSGTRWTDSDTANNSTNEAVMVSATVNVAMAKQGPSTGLIGDPITYQVTATNSGTSKVNGITIADTVPSTLTAVTWTCTATAGSSCATASGSGNDVNLTANVAPNGVVTLTITGTVATAAAGTTITNIAAVAVPSGFTNNGTASDSVDTAIAPSADLATTKQVQGTTPVAPGRAFDYEITIANEGPSQATNVTATDILPAALSFVSGPGCSANGRTVTCGPQATLDANDSHSWAITVKLNPAYAGDGSDIRNVATGASDVDDPNPDNDSSNPNADDDNDGHPDGGVPGGTVADPESDLSTTKQVQGTTPVVPGRTFDYLITIANAGPSDAPNVKATDVLPATLTFVSGAGCTASGQTVTCGPRAALAIGASASWTITVKLAPSYTGDGSEIRNVATASSDAVDPDPGNNASDPNADDDNDGHPDGGIPGGAAGDPSADLSTAKVALNPAPVSAGSYFDYRVTVTNAGPSNAANVTVTDDLPIGLLFSLGTDCSASGQTVTCGPQATLAPGDSAVWTFTVQIDPGYTGDGSDLGNIATAHTDTDDPDSGNDSNQPGVMPNGGVTARPTITEPADGAVTGDDTPTFTGTGVLGYSVTVVIGNAEPVCTGPVQAGGTWTCTPTTPLADGTDTYTPVADDGNGGKIAGTPVEITVDSEAPPPPSAIRVIGDLDGSGVTVTGSGEPGDTVVVDGSTGVPVCSAVVAADGSWSCHGEIVGDGPLMVTQTDPVGNTSEPVSVLETDLDVSIILPLDITDTGIVTVTVSNNGPMVAPGAEFILNLPWILELAGPAEGADCEGDTTLVCRIEDQIDNTESANTESGAAVTEAVMAEALVAEATVSIPVRVPSGCRMNDGTGTAAVFVAPTEGSDMAGSDNTAAAEVSVPAGGNCATQNGPGTATGTGTGTETQTLPVTGTAGGPIVQIGLLAVALGSALVATQWLGRTRRTQN